MPPFFPRRSDINSNILPNANNGFPFANNIPPKKIPKKSDIYTCFVIKANTIATIAGTNAQNVPIILSIKLPVDKK